METKDKNGVPLYIKTRVYYVIYDNKKILYDVEEMKLEIENQLDNLPDKIK